MFKINDNKKVEFKLKHFEDYVLLKEINIENLKDIYMTYFENDLKLPTLKLDNVKDPADKIIYKRIIEDLKDIIVKGKKIKEDIDSDFKEAVEKYNK